MISIALFLVLQAVPPELEALPQVQYRIWHVKDSSDRYLRTRISLTTHSRTLDVIWTGQAGTNVRKEFVSQSHRLSFAPTAMTRSIDDPHALYLAGTSDTGSPVLQRWDLGSPTLRAAPRPDGEKGRESADAQNLAGVTVFTIPAIEKTTLAVDPRIGHIADLTVNPRPGGEEVWLLEWETGDVITTDPVTGVKNLIVAGTELHGARSMNTMRHTVYGNVFIFMKKMWWHTRFKTHELKYSVLYDSNQDGVLDGQFIEVDWMSRKETPLYTSGEWIDPWPYP